MTRKKHKERHAFLHRMFDELWADYLRHNIKVGDKKPKLGDDTTINDLLKWSFQQTQNPTESDEPHRSN